MQMNFDINNVFSVLRRTALLSSVCLAAGLVGCSSTPSTPGSTQVEKVSATDAPVEDAVFAKGLTKSNEPENPTNDFTPNETICLSLKFKGRPKAGVVTAKFYCEEQLITETKVDFASANGDVIFSVGEDTFVGFSLTHPNPFPVSSKYRAETFLDGKPLGTYKFNVADPGKGAASKN